MDARHATLKIGDYLDLSTRHIQAFDGGPLSIRCIITEMNPVNTALGSHFEYKLVQIVADPDGS